MVIYVFSSVGPEGHKIIPQFAEVNVGNSVQFRCLSDLTYDKRGFIIRPSWIFEKSIHVDSIAEKQGYQRIYIKTANSTHNGQYTCVGYKRSKLTKINFLATARLVVLGKIQMGSTK